MTTPYPAYGGYPPPGQDRPYDPRQNGDAGRGINRTPSPTPSEQKELSTGVFDWRRMSNWRFWVRKDWLWYYVGAVIIMVIAALITLYHKQIVDWLMPAANWMKDLKFGYLIPIAVLFVISFPPLFGHEVVAILCGVVWGIGWGFAIVAAGTFLGEIGNFYAFKYCLRGRAEKFEKTKISYACLAQIIRDGGIWIPLIARLSAIPGHFTTAVFSTCGMGIVVFCISAFLSLPKQFVTVYLGVILHDAGDGKVDTKTKIINYTVIGVTTLITIAAMWYIYHKMNKVKPEVIYQRRKARQAKVYQNAAFAASSSSASLTSRTYPVGNAPDVASTDHIPLDRYAESPYQQWDTNGRAVGYTGDPRVYQPHPRRQESSFDAYKPYGGPPQGMVESSSVIDISSNARDEFVASRGGAGASANTRTQTGTRAGEDAASYVPTLPPPPQSPRSPRSLSPVQTATQAQFAIRHDSDLVSAPLATPTYSTQPPAAGQWAITNPVPASPATGSNNPYHAGQVQNPSGYASPSVTYAVGPPMTAGYFAQQQGPPLHQSQPGTPVVDPTYPMGHFPTSAQGHALEGSDATFYTAAPAHSREGTTSSANMGNHSGAPPRYAPQRNASVQSSMANPYAGYVSGVPGSPAAR